MKNEKNSPHVRKFRRIGDPDVEFARFLFLADGKIRNIIH